MGRESGPTSFSGQKSSNTPSSSFPKVSFSPCALTEHHVLPSVPTLEDCCQLCPEVFARAASRASPEACDRCSVAPDTSLALPGRTLVAAAKPPPGIHQCTVIDQATRLSYPMFRGPPGGRSKATPTTLCQKCLKRDTYSLGCCALPELTYTTALQLRMQCVRPRAALQGAPIPDAAAPES